MLNAVLWYTILCVALNEVASGGGSNLLTAEEAETIKSQPAMRAERVKGSKWVFVSEHAFILCIWSLKACMLVIYARITYVWWYPCSDGETFADNLAVKDCVNENGSITLLSMSLWDLSALKCLSSLSVDHCQTIGLFPRRTVRTIF